MRGDPTELERGAATLVAIAHCVVWCADDVGVAGAEFLRGPIVAIRDPGLLVLGDSRWVRDSKAFLSGPLVLAGLAICSWPRFAPRAALVGGSGCPPQLGLPVSHRCAYDFSETHHRRLSAP